MDELDAISDEAERYNRLVELNVQEQCINIAKTVIFQKTYAGRVISLHGWVFDISTGKLKDLEIDIDKMMKTFMQVYKLA